MKFIFTFSHNLGEISRKICRRRRDNFEKKFHRKKKKSETTRKCDANYREIFRCRPIKFFITNRSPDLFTPPLHFFILKKINWITRPIKRHNNLQLDGGRPSGWSTKCAASDDVISFFLEKKILMTKMSPFVCVHDG